MEIKTSSGRVIHRLEGELAGADPRGVKLSGASLSEISLRGTGFTDAILTGAPLGMTGLSLPEPKNGNA